MRTFFCALLFFFDLYFCHSNQENSQHHAQFSKLINGKNNNEVILISKRGSNNVPRLSYFKKSPNKLDLTKLKKLSIDQKERVAHAEACVTMNQLVRSCLHNGLLPKVALDFKSITVGGAVMGAGIESSSHANGLFSDTCREFTILKGNGEIVRCSQKQNAQLFNAVCGSFGTLGVLLDATIQLEPCEKYTRVNFRAFPSVDEALVYMKDLCETKGTNGKAVKFVDAVVLPPEHGGKTVVMAADYCSQLKKGEGLCRLGHSWSNWYIERIRLKASSGASEWELVHPTYDYVFRFERGCFWMARPMAFKVANLTPVTAMHFLLSDRNIVSRVLFRWLYTARRLYKILHITPPQIIARKMVIMDTHVAWRYASKLVRYVRATVPITTPLWLCPVRPATCHKPFAPNGGGENDMLINVGIYGRVADGQAKMYSRRLEHWITAHKGRKMLYSQNFFTEKEFWGDMFDKKEYDDLRKAYGATSFPGLLEKTCSEYSEVADEKLSIKNRLSRLFSSVLL